MVIVNCLPMQKVFGSRLLLPCSEQLFAQTRAGSLIRQESAYIQGQYTPDHVSLSTFWDLFSPWWPVEKARLADTDNIGLDTQAQLFDRPQAYSKIYAFLEFDP